MQEIFVEIYLFILCINGAILLVDSLSDTPLVTPFDISKQVQGKTMPSIYNSTSSSNTLVNNMTTNVRNGTGSSTVLNFLQDSFFYPLAILQGIINFLTGGFIWQALALFGMPIVFVYVLQGILGFLLARTILYYVTGR
jgi:hypothetical protein